MELHIFGLPRARDNNKTAESNFVDTIVLIILLHARIPVYKENIEKSDIRGKHAKLVCL